MIRGGGVFLFQPTNLLHELLLREVLLVGRVGRQHGLDVLHSRLLDLKLESVIIN